jgi:AcrR family transcriptional regulator
MTAVQPRQSADERRESVVAEATREFAAHGFAGTSTMAFIAALRECFGRVRTRFETVGRRARQESTDTHHILHAMGMAYCDLLADREMLRLQLQAYAACDDPDIRLVVRQEWTALYDSVARISGADDDALYVWFAEGMLMNVAAAVGGLNPEIDAKMERGGLWSD